MQALRHYTHIVLDEIHERDLDMDRLHLPMLGASNILQLLMVPVSEDLLCLLLKRSLEKNPSLPEAQHLSVFVVDASFLEHSVRPGAWFS